MKEAPYWNPLVPEMTDTSLQESLRFYQAAGFSVRHRRESPPFACLELGHAQLMLEQRHAEGWNVEPLDKPFGRGINFQIEVPDVGHVLSSLLSLNFIPFRSLKDSWYRVAPDAEKGQREFLVQDPDGFLLRFVQHLGQRSAA